MALYERRVAATLGNTTNNRIESQSDRASFFCWTLFLLSEIRRRICWHSCPTPRLDKEAHIFQMGTWTRPSFQRVKATSAPILGMPRDEGTYYLDTNASDLGLGAVLSQEQDGHEVVLAYASRTLTRAEKNYDVTWRELLAVVYGLKTYRQYLLGRNFMMRTDHSALQSLRRTPELIGQ